jgi:hypothetical protein
MGMNGPHNIKSGRPSSPPPQARYGDKTSADLYRNYELKLENDLLLKKELLLRSSSDQQGSVPYYKQPVTILDYVTLSKKLCALEMHKTSAESKVYKQKLMDSALFPHISMDMDSAVKVADALRTLDLSRTSTQDPNVVHWLNFFTDKTKEILCSMEKPLSDGRLFWTDICVKLLLLDIRSVAKNPGVHNSSLEKVITCFEEMEQMLYFQSEEDENPVYLDNATVVFDWLVGKIEGTKEAHGSAWMYMGAHSEMLLIAPSLAQRSVKMAIKMKKKSMMEKWVFPDVYPNKPKNNLEYVDSLELSSEQEHFLEHMKAMELYENNAVPYAPKEIINELSSKEMLKSLLTIPHDHEILQYVNWTLVKDVHIAYLLLRRSESIRWFDGNEKRLDSVLDTYGYALYPIVHGLRGKSESLYRQYMVFARKKKLISPIVDELLNALNRCEYDKNLLRCPMVYESFIVIQKGNITLDTWLDHGAFGFVNDTTEVKVISNSSEMITMTLKVMANCYGDIQRAMSFVTYLGHRGFTRGKHVGATLRVPYSGTPQEWEDMVEFLSSNSATLSNFLKGKESSWAYPERVYNNASLMRDASLEEASWFSIIDPYTCFNKGCVSVRVPMGSNDPTVQSLVTVVDALLSFKGSTIGEHVYTSTFLRRLRVPENVISNLLKNPIVYNDLDLEPSLPTHAPLKQLTHTSDDWRGNTGMNAMTGYPISGYKGIQGSTGVQVSMGNRGTVISGTGYSYAIGHGDTISGANNVIANRTGEALDDIFANMVSFTKRSAAHSDHDELAALWGDTPDVSAPLEKPVRPTMKGGTTRVK